MDKYSYISLYLSFHKKKKRGWKEENRTNGKNIKLFKFVFINYLKDAKIISKTSETCNSSSL